MKTVLVLFGGQSSEHDISCISVRTVVRAIDRTKYEPVLVGITKQGKWIYTEDLSQIESGRWTEGKVQAVLSPDAEEHALYLMQYEVVTGKIRIDLAFPVLHGLNGEDGTVQGIFELMQIPYVGPNVLSCAVSMDKFYTKIIVDAIGIRQADYVGVRREELSDMEAVLNRVEEKLSYPVFVKPSCAGSSKGVSKASDRKSLETALLIANLHDSKILVEETINGRELECAAFSSGSEVRVIGPGEVVAGAEFYDFDAKYNNSESRTDTAPVLPFGIAEQIRLAAEKIFRAVDAYGLSRVDFFLDDQGLVFNEINSIPGFTAISMYPMLFESAGVPHRELVQMLLDSAEARGPRVAPGTV